MAKGQLEPVSRAAKAVAEGRAPDPDDFRVCRSLRWPGADASPVNMRCWNGQRSDRPECKAVGSENWPVYAETGLERWQFHLALARCWEEEGHFGKEIGSPGDFYCRGVLGCMNTARQRVKGQDAETIRRAIRSAVAWDTMTALPIGRLVDVIHYSDRTVTARNPLGVKARRLTVAVAGMRWSEKAQDRTTLTSEDAHSAFLADVLLGGAGTMAGVLTPDELQLVRAAVGGDISAARAVAGWMFGTIHAPDVEWRFRLRRTTLGAESLFLGQYPNPMKPMRVCTQIGTDGTWTGMRPSPEDSPNKWADGFHVEIQDGVIHASCAAGEASLPELGGDVIWQVDVDGAEVRFSA